MMTLMPGDLIATGTPAGVGPLVDGRHGGSLRGGDWRVAQSGAICRRSNFAEAWSIR